jgi:AcrR family transcriptional regulator
METTRALVTSTAQPDPPPGAAPLRKGERTRRRLLEAASRVFARHGYLNAEIGQITQEAGKSIGVFYAYFNNKAELLASLLDAFNVEMAQRVKSQSNPPEHARFVVSVLWNTYKAHAATLLALRDAATIDPSFAAALEAHRDFARADFAGMIRTRQTQGRCLGMDPRLGAMALEAMISQCLYEWLGQGLGAFQDEAEERRAFETLAGVIEAVLGVEGSSPSEAETTAP